VGRVPRRYLAANGWTSPTWEATFGRDTDANAHARFDLVVADGGFFTMGFLAFAEYLLHLRDALKPGGTLVLIRKPISFHDEFFIYRSDEFFENELPAAAAADFAETCIGSWKKYRTLEMKGRLAPEEAESRRAAQPVDSLVHLFSMAAGSPYPSYIWTAPTTRCNLRCRTCSVRGGPPGEDMSDEIIDRIFDTLDESAELINVTGIGEPLFSRTWKHLYARVRGKAGRMLEIVSNGVLLTEEVVREMMKPGNRTSLVISVDGNSQETFEWIRDRGKWDRMVSVMEMIRRVRHELQPGPSFWLGVDFTAIKENIHELPAFVERAATEWEVDGVLVIDMGDWITNREFFLEQAIRFHPELANKYFGLAREMATKHRIRFFSCPDDFSTESIERINSRTSLPPLPRLLRVLQSTLGGIADLCGRAALTRRLAAKAERLAEAWLRNAVGLPRGLRQRLRQQVEMADNDAFGHYSRVKGYCRVVNERAFFHTNGDVASCCGLIYTMFGNIRREPFDAIWNSPTYREFRIMNLLGYPHSACFYCTLPYGLPAKNPENFISQHSLPYGSNRLARNLRKARQRLAQWGV
jgi:MoaA/NifB/PqqE/SkfB family radical SAM enzyme